MSTNCYRTGEFMADTYQSIRCPACGNVMKKVFIPSVGVNIDICADGCGGIYFDAKELQLMQKVSGDDIQEINSYLEAKQFTPVDESEARMCPNCSSNMVKTRINGLDVQVDTCYSCGAVFLDYGELDAIRASYNNRTRNSYNSVSSSASLNQSNDYLRELYRDAQRENSLRPFEFNRSYYRLSDCIVDFIGFLLR